MAKGIDSRQTRVPEMKCVVLRTIHRLQKMGVPVKKCVGL
jgi:hypothetical protein